MRSFEVVADDDLDRTLGQIGPVEDDAAAEYSTDVPGHRERVGARQDLGLPVPKTVGVERRRQVHVEAGESIQDGLAHAELAAPVEHLDGHGGVVGRRPPGDAGLDLGRVGHEGELPFGDARPGREALHDGRTGRDPLQDFTKCGAGLRRRADAGEPGALLLRPQGGRLERGPDQCGLKVRQITASSPASEKIAGRSDAATVPPSLTISVWSLMSAATGRSSWTWNWSVPAQRARSETGRV